MDSRPSNAVKAVIEGIHRQINGGLLRTGSTLPSEQLLASTFSVSRGTVRRAIEYLVADGSLARRPHARPIIAANPASQRAGDEVYVWVSHPIADDQSLYLVKEISKGLRGTKYKLVVREPSRFVGTVVRSEERDFLTSVLTNPKVAGVIIERDPFSDNSDVVQRLIDRGMDLVFVDTPPPAGIPADHVGTTNLTSARICVEHLLNLGHTHIWCVADSDVPSPVKERMKGYNRAMRQAGLEGMAREIVASELPELRGSEVRLAGQYVRVIKNNEYFSKLASQAVEEILSAPTRPTALFVCHDVMAFWMCAMLEARGVSIPDEISVVGFDWIARWDVAIPDTLTTAYQDFAGFGRHAVNLLLDRLNGEAPAESRHVLLDAPLVVRASTTSDLSLPDIDPITPSRAMLPK